MIKAKFLSIAIMLCSALNPTAEAKTYKWIDDQGETHYGEVIPPEFAGKNKVQFDDKGRVIKEKKLEESKDASVHQTPEQKAASEQLRKDKALLNTYSNEKEIDLARDRNLQQVDSRVYSISLLIQSAQESLDSFRKEASLIKPGKPIPASLQSDIETAENKLTKLKQDLDAANEKAASVKSSFEFDKVRYHELTSTPKK